MIHAQRFASAVAVALCTAPGSGAQAATPLYEYVALPSSGYDTPYYDSMNDRLKFGGSTTGAQPADGQLLDARGRVTTFQLPGFPITVVTSVNNAGDAAGAAIDQSTGRGHAFVRWADGRLVDLDGGRNGYSGARAINDAKVVAGYAGPPGPDARERAFVWSTGVFKWLPDLGGRGMDVGGMNDRGVIVGRGYDAADENHAVRWVEGQLEILPGLDGGHTDFDSPYAVNASGWIVGRCTAATYAQQPCAWDPEGRVQALATLEPNVQGDAVSINDDGVIVGELWSDDGSSRAIRFLDGHGLDLETRVVGQRPPHLDHAISVDRLGRILVHTVDGTYGVLWPLRVDGANDESPAVVGR